MLYKISSDIYNICHKYYLEETKSVMVKDLGYTDIAHSNNACTHQNSELIKPINQ